jgi:polysaccharide pyruvyl transferase WcaK-like protein
MIITMLDTSVATDNLGDEVILDCITMIVRSLFPDAYVYRVATHEYMTGISRAMIRRSDLSILCGTSILCSNMIYTSPWKLRPWDPFLLRNIVALGIGWRDSARRTNAYTRWLIRNALSTSMTHSTRDNFAQSRLAELGRVALNTGCPTMWELNPAHCATIPTKKADQVVAAVTWYKPNRGADTALLYLLSRTYKRVYCWPQQAEDKSYVDSLAVPGIAFVRPSVREYDRLLENEEVDYVGLRLHGGIRALQHRRRTLILPVDNRATDISADTGLPVIARDRLGLIEEWIWGEQSTTLQLPTGAIENWKRQFR